MPAQHKILLLFILTVAIVVRLPDVVRPIDHSSWREADVGSIARNYATESMNPIYPRIDWRGETEGYVESEFPIFPYLIALSYKVFGINDFFGRIWAFCFSLATIWFFFCLSRQFFDGIGLVATFAFFVLNPLIVEFSTAIQPEGVMICFYVAAAYFFEKWFDNRGKKDFILASIFTAFAILAKSSAAHIGLFFGLALIQRDGLEAIRKPKNWIFAIISLLPGLLWFLYAKSLYKTYGNSLGISNEYHWIGPDFFTNSYFIKGILHSEYTYVWGIGGLLVGIYAVTRGFRELVVIHSLFWLLSCFVFYIVASRTTADEWAYYYHIFSVPAASLLFGFGIAKLIQDLNVFQKRVSDGFRGSLIHRILTISIIGICAAAVFIFQASQIKELFRERAEPDVNYVCATRIQPFLDKGNKILASGGRCFDADGFMTAYNASYMFYWLDRKGFNICYEEQSIEKVLDFREKDARYFIAEKKALDHKTGFEDALRKRFNVVTECDGIIVFDLSN